MVTRKELEKQGWVYVCCESKSDGYENTTQLHKMGVPDSNIKYIPPKELTDIDFPKSVLENLTNSNYRAVFYKPLKKANSPEH